MDQDQLCDETGVIVEREVPHPPERSARAYPAALIEEWLLKEDFQAVVDTSSNLSATGARSDVRSRAVEPKKTLVTRLEAYGLESVVTWTLTPTRTEPFGRGALGLRQDSRAGYRGANSAGEFFC